MKLAKRTEKIILLLMGEEIILRKTKSKDVGQFLKLMLERKQPGVLQKMKKIN